MPDAPRVVLRCEDEVVARIGEDLGESGAVTIAQEMVAGFGAVTGSDDWIHTDPTRASASVFGGPIAQGDLLVSLFPRLVQQVLLIECGTHGLVYGSDRVRLLGPVRVGSAFRVRPRLAAAERQSTGLRVVLDAEGWVDGADRASVVARFIHFYAD